MSMPGGGAIRVPGVLGSCFLDMSPLLAQCGLLSCALRSYTVAGCCRIVSSYLSGYGVVLERDLLNRGLLRSFAKYSRLWDAVRPRGSSAASSSSYGAIRSW